MFGAYENNIVGAIVRGNDGLLMQVLKQAYGCLYRNVISCMLQTNYRLAYKVIAEKKNLKTHQRLTTKEAYTLLRPFCYAVVDLSFLIIMLESKAPSDEQIEKNVNSLALSKRDCAVLNKLQDCHTRTAPINLKTLARIAMLQFSPEKLKASVAFTSIIPQKTKLWKQSLPWWCVVEKVGFKAIHQFIKPWNVSQAEFEKLFWFYEIVGSGMTERYVSIAQLPEVKSLIQSNNLVTHDVWRLYSRKIQEFLELIT